MSNSTTGTPRRPFLPRVRARVSPAAPAAPAVDPAAREALCAQAVEHLPHGLSMFDARGGLMVANTRYLQIWGLPSHLGQRGTPYAEIRAAIRGREVLRTPSHGPDGQPLPRRREWQMDDGRVIEVTVTRLADGSLVAVHQDITVQRRAELQVAHMARHDTLTGMPNRVLLREEMERSLTRTQRGEALAVLCLDLDRFKAVNDTLGHAAGDALLREVATRLRSFAREGDVVARLGGDEFAMLQVGAPQPEGSTALGRRLVQALSQPFDLGGHQVHIGTSIGVAIAPYDGEDPEHLLKCADLALYRAKGEGRGQLRYFEPDMDARMKARRQLEADLRGAIARGEFELAYQPLVTVASRQVTALEALIRWNHPTRGVITPAEFVPLAEETGMITVIGQWVLQQACRDAAHWPPQVSVAVNVSAMQFKSRTLVRDTMLALAQSGLPPQRLELEITESTLLQDTDQALAILEELRGRGVRVSMDDFGTGFSSLSYLRRFMFDKIKIDRSFVRDIGRSGDALAVIEAVVSLCRSLGMGTTAEGVETAEQLEALRRAGCAEVQGYLLSRPCPAGEVARLILEGAEPAPAHDHILPQGGPACTSDWSTSAVPSTASASVMSTTSFEPPTTGTVVTH